LSRILAGEQRVERPGDEPPALGLGDLGHEVSELEVIGLSDRLLVDRVLVHRRQSARVLDD
jgi:hypothetical protein